MFALVPYLAFQIQGFKMKGKICLNVLSLVLLSALFLSSYGSSQTASAATPYDNVVQNSDGLYLNAKGSGCTEVAISWTDQWENNIRQQIQMKSGSMTQQWSDSWDNRVYTMIQSVDDNSTRTPFGQKIIVYWTTDPLTSSVFDGGYWKITAENLNGIVIETESSASNSGCSMNINNGWLTSWSNLGTVWFQDNANIKTFINDVPFFPPEGYVGDEPGHGAPPVPNLNDDISLYWKTEDKLVTLVHKTTNPPLNNDIMTCRWQFTDEDGNKLLDKITPCNEENFQQVTVEDYGTFQVNLDILYDKNNDTVIVPDESIGTIQSNIEVYGEFQEGMIGHDWFEVDTDYKDCSTYGADLVGALGCHFFNFGLRIRDFFIPDSAALAREFREFSGYMEVKLGFVWQAFAMPIELLGDMVTGFASPTCQLSLGNLSGQNVSISLCQVRSMVGSAPFDLLLNIFRGAVALGFIFTSARYANAFFSNRSAGQI